MVSEHEKKSRGGLTIEEGVPLGEVLATQDSRVIVCRELDQAQADEVFSMIEWGFSDHNENSLLKQDMSREEFQQEAADSSVLKYLAVGNHSSEILGYLSVHSDMDDIVWADHDMLKRRQESFGPGEHCFYVGTFVVPRELRGFRLSGVLLEAALGQLRNFNIQNGYKSLCYFDRAESGSGAMKEYIRRKLDKITGGQSEFSIEEIDSIYYAAIPDEYLYRDGPPLPGLYGQDPAVIHTKKGGREYFVVPQEAFDSTGRLKKNVISAIRAEQTNYPGGSGQAVIETRQAEFLQGTQIIDAQHFYQITPAAATPVSAPVGVFG